MSSLAVVLPLLVVFAWLPAIDAPYHYDDYNTPVGDPASQSLTSWWHVMPQTLRPLTKLSYALESSLGATDAPSRRLFNTLVFGVCVALVRGLLRRAGASPWVALALATAWALHPVHAETIVALAGRPVLLCLVFTLASASCVLDRRPWWALGFAGLAVLARESGLPWLAVCAGLSAAQLGWSRRRLVLGVTAALAVALGVVFSVPALRQLVISSLTSPGAINRLGLQWAALARGTVGLVITPTSFTLDMDFNPTGATRLSWILGAFALYGGAAWLAWRGHARFRRVGAQAEPNVRVSALLWLCLVIPTHSVIPKVDPFTARPFSASSAPLLVLALAVGLALHRRWRDERAPTLATTLTGATSKTPRPISPYPSRVAALTAATVMTLALPALAAATHERATLYRDPVALWRDAAERSSHKTRPWVNLGTLLAKRGELASAREAFATALGRDPQSFEIRARLGVVSRLDALTPARDAP